MSGAQVDHGHMFAALEHAGTARIILGGRFGEENSAISWQRLDRFVEGGGRIVDTAHSYADGRSEEVIGAWMRAHPGTLLVVDKIGYPDQHGAVDLSATSLRREVTESLRRLGAPSIDVVLLHRDSPDVPVEYVASTLANLVSDDLARHIGVSNWSADRLDQITRALASAGQVPVVSYQRSLAVPVAPLWPGARHADPSISDTISRHRLPLLAWAAQARGFFTGTTELPSADQPDPFDSPANRERRRRCQELARNIGSRPETVALAWLLRHHGIWPVIGPRSVAELDTSLDALRLDLNPEAAHWLAEAPR